MNTRFRRRDCAAMKHYMEFYVYVFPKTRVISMYAKIITIV